LLVSPWGSCAWLRYHGTLRDQPVEGFVARSVLGFCWVGERDGRTFVVTE
jgi:hypothetical protein